MKKSLHIFTLFIFSLTLISVASQAKALDLSQIREGFNSKVYVNGNNSYNNIRKFYKETGVIYVETNNDSNDCEEVVDEFLDCVDEAEENNTSKDVCMEDLEETNPECKGAAITSLALMGYDGSSSFSAPSSEMGSGTKF